MLGSETMTIIRALLACTIAAGVAACATGRSSPASAARSTDTRYLYQLLDARKLGAQELVRIEKENAVVAGYVARAGNPDFLIEPSLTDLELVYYGKSLLVHFHQGADGTWTSSEVTPLPTSLLDVLPGDIRAGTPTASGNEMTGCWATTITGGSCQTCCTPPDTPAAQNCTIQCRQGKS
jgi:hypothetical protein